MSQIHDCPIAKWLVSDDLKLPVPDNAGPATVERFHVGIKQIVLGEDKDARPEFVVFICVDRQDFDYPVLLGFLPAEARHLAGALSSALALLLKEERRAKRLAREIGETA